MTDQDREHALEAADRASLIEQAAADLRMAEEPAGFLAVLEHGAANE